jgi:hypothetical protein
MTTYDFSKNDAAVYVRACVRAFVRACVRVSACAIERARVCVCVSGGVPHTCVLIACARRRRLIFLRGILFVSALFFLLRLFFVVCRCPAAAAAAACCLSVPNTRCTVRARADTTASCRCRCRCSCVCSGASSSRGSTTRCGSGPLFRQPWVRACVRAVCTAGLFVDCPQRISFVLLAGR